MVVLESFRLKGDRLKMKLRTSRMVGDIPMDVVYRGMSLERLEKLNDLESDAWLVAQSKHENVVWDFKKFTATHEAEFRKLLDRAATKAAWHRNNRKVSK